MEAMEICVLANTFHDTKETPFKVSKSGQLVTCGETGKKRPFHFRGPSWLLGNPSFHNLADLFLKIVLGGMVAAVASLRWGDLRRTHILSLVLDSGSVLRGTCY